MKLFKNDITLDCADEMKKYLLAYDHESSAQCFSSLVTWAQVHDFCWDILEGHIVIEGTYRPNQGIEHLVHYIFPPIPADGKPTAEGIRAAVLAAKKVFDEAGEPFMIKRIPGNMKAAFEEAFPDTELIEDRTYFDYVYSLEELSELRGKKFHSKKNHVNAFERDYEFELKEFTPDMTPEVLDLVDRLNAARNDTPEDAGGLDYERRVIELPLRNAPELGCIGVSIYIGGRMEAFALGGPLSETTICEHFEKASVEFRGLYAAINRAFCRMARDAGYTFVNREEDMGSENLRKSKLSYRPIKLIDKYEMVF